MAQCSIPLIGIQIPYRWWIKNSLEHISISVTAAILPWLVGLSIHSMTIPVRSVLIWISGFKRFLVKVCLICIFSSNIVKQIFFRLLPFNIQCMSYYTFKCNYYSNFTSLRRKMWFYWIYCHSDKLFHIMLYRVHLAWAGFELTLVVIGTDYISSCKSNYYSITTTTALETNVIKTPIQWNCKFYCKCRKN